MNTTTRTFAFIGVTFVTLGTMVACSGGGHASRAVDDGVDIIGNTGDGGWNNSTGSGGTTGSGGSSGSGGWTGSGGSSGSGGDTSGCDASGCNSFGTGGSKNTALRAGQLNQAQIAAKAAAVSAQFDMSLDSATRLTQLANQVVAMKQQGQMTQADKDAVIQNTFGIAGVTSDEVNNAVAKSQAGDDSALNDVMDKAAVGLGMPSGATMRDKILPLFKDAQ